MDKDRIALITGGTRGIGAAMVRVFSSAGFRVVYTGREALKKPADVKGAVYLSLELMNDESVESLCRAMVQRELRPSVLVNNAGVNIIESVYDLENASWDAVLKVNLTGAMKLARAFAVSLHEAGSMAHILNISSIWGIVSKPGRAAYSATKAGLIGLTRALALDLAPHGILVNALCPGFTDTELTSNSLGPDGIAEIEGMIPLGRMAHVDEIARAALFLCSSRNTYMTGQALVVDGGYTVQ